MIALEAGARDHVEDAISAVAELGAVASAIDFEIVDVLGIKLRAEIGGDVGIGNGHAVDEPTGLMSAADVELVVSEIGAGHVVGNHGEAVGAGGAGGVFDVEAVDEGGRSGGIGGATSGAPETLMVSFVTATVREKCRTGS